MSSSFALSSPPESLLYSAPHSASSPLTLHPPSDVPFEIPPSLYTAALDVRVPLSVAVVYATTVHFLNRRATGKPYAIANTRAFKAFVTLHNLFLAIYSLATFIAMVRAVHTSIVYTRGVQSVVESLCKIFPDTRGVAGESGELEMKVGNAGGRGLWEEGLAWWGWWFYISKFYEVVDTAVILAKGRKSSVLQTYHHAGAMICMWAGIKYMAPPIWTFCVFNSLIHFLMYTYYTLSTLSIRVPSFLKRSLTTLQISQFVIGGSFAAIHLFIWYTPITSFASGERSSSPSLSSSSSSSSAAPANNTMVSCLSSSNETFAVLINCAYLTPLTWLFVKFFLDSYTVSGRQRRAEKTRCTLEKAKGRVEAGAAAGEGIGGMVGGHGHGHGGGKVVVSR